MEHCTKCGGVGHTADECRWQIEPGAVININLTPEEILTICAALGQFAVSQDRLRKSVQGSFLPTDEKKRVCPTINDRVIYAATLSTKMSGFINGLRK